MTYAPIIIFAFNRLKPLQACVVALQANSETKESDLIVFVDGARPQKHGETEKVQAVRNYVRTINGFKSLTFHFSEQNKGLGPSKVISKYGRVIVLEDDLIVAPGFLSYMNTMLDAYKDNKRIMQVSGFSTQFEIPKNYPYDVYLNRRGESWSWGTWKESWDLIDWDVKDFYKIQNSKKLQKEFNDIGSDMYDMLKSAVKSGRIWAVKFAFTMFMRGAYQVSPIYSLVRNDGFNADSTNCNEYNRYKYIFNETQHTFVAPLDLPYNRKMDKDANRYWSIRYRIWGKFMTLYSNMFK